MAERLKEPQSYFVVSLLVRRQLVPVPGQPKDVRCLTFRADEPQEGDIVLADQVAFENILIGLRLMQPRDLVQKGFGALWRGLSLDQLMVRPAAEGHKETLLHYID